MISNVFCAEVRDGTCIHRLWITVFSQNDWPHERCLEELGSFSDQGRGIPADAGSLVRPNIGH